MERQQKIPQRCLLHSRRKQLSRKNMEESCPRNRHLSLRIMKGLTLILLIGLWESKVWQSRKDHLKHLGLSCSPLNSKPDTGDLLMHQQMVKREEEIHLRKLQTSEGIRCDGMRIGIATPLS